MTNRKIIAILFTLFAWMACGDNHSDKTAQSGDKISDELIEQIIEPFNRGVALMDQFRPVEAVAAFTEVVEKAPNWNAGHLNLGIALLNTQNDNDYIRAETELKRVSEQSPDNPYAHYALGMLFLHLSRQDEARARFEAVLKIDPDDSDAHYQLGSLLMEQDPNAAKKHLKKTLAAIPHHESACYRLQQTLRKLGEKEKAQELMIRFRALKESKSGLFSGMKYSEMGRYANIIKAFEPPHSNPESNLAPEYKNIARQAGLDFAVKGKRGWPTENEPLSAAGFGPGIAAAEIEGDGELAIFIPGGSDGKGALYRNNNGKLTLVKNSGVNAKNAIGAYFGDYNSDGAPDLYLTCAGPNKLYRNNGNLTFTDVTKVSGTSGGGALSVGATWADADHDGDQDIYVANYAPGGNKKQNGAKNYLWRNNGDGSFTETAGDMGIDGGTAQTVSALFFDFDDDRDLDLYLINHKSANQIFLNDRVGQYTDAAAWFPELLDEGDGLGALTADLDGNGREDLLLLRGKSSPRLFLQLKRGRFAEDNAFAAQANKMGGAVGSLVGDIDLDGDFDLIFLDAGSEESLRHRVMMNKGDGQFEPPTPFGEERKAPAARGAIATDLDGDGSLELLVAQVDAPAEIWRAEAPTSRHWLQVIPSDKQPEEQWVDPTANGLTVEVKAGRHVQVASIHSSSGYLGAPPLRTIFGLGGQTDADYVRLNWPDAVLQSEIEVAADQSWRIKKVSRKPSSCPILFSWDGERFSFVTDFLGVGGVGFFMSPGEYAPPDPTEDIRIPPEMIATANGKYLLRITEPLEEVTYLDQLHLIAYDHPDSLELQLDERFTGTPPFPTARPYLSAKKIFPVAAANHQGESQLEILRHIDRNYVKPPRDRRFVGYADEHWLELDFGDQLASLSPESELIMHLYGWVEYTFSHINYAATQAGITMQSPKIEIPDGNGGWKTVVAEMGFPAGLPRMMTFNISALPVRENARLRITSNMEIFWDQIFLAENINAKTRKHILTPDLAELRHIGFPREFSPDGEDPTMYDYHRIDHGVPFKNMTGDYTRFGDVRQLLQSVDDRFVIMAKGDEIALEFDATNLPKLQLGWRRTIVLHSDGYCKDMDLYTAYPNSVEPFPFHQMQNYPPKKAQPDPKGFANYQSVWNTRRVAAQ